MIIFTGCENILDLRPKDKLDGIAMFSDPEGVKLYMANLYSQLPIEDFNYRRDGFNGWIGENMYLSMFTEEATHSEYSAFLDPNNLLWWEDGYSLIRDVNLLDNVIPTLNVSDQQRNSMIGEVAFIKAYAYYYLVKLYGGVPIIDELQEYTGDADDLKVPRSTEKDTWDYVLRQCDIAARNLPSVWAGGERRATKWVAYALKSRAALHAASIAKYGERAAMSGEAVTKLLVGIDKSYADYYYEETIKACRAIMDSSSFTLYKENPANANEAAENYRKLFEFPQNATDEVIFIKGYTLPGSGHDNETTFNPAQTANGWPHPGRMCPNLELIDQYESYTYPGSSAPIQTSTAPNDLTDYSGFNVNKAYHRYDNPYEIFKNKDVRLWGTVILPGTQWKGVDIIIQAGLIKPDGTAQILTGDPFTYNGKTYYTYGAANNTGYSGFNLERGNYTRTGFGFKKFLDSATPVVYGYRQGLVDYIDFRFAEILLNYAEAVVESNYMKDDAQNQAYIALNRIRHRAAHTVNIPLTIQNVQRERLVELAFENKRFWDLIRRREFHTLFHSKKRHALQPILDLRVTPAKYIFVRSEIQNSWPATFYEQQYYRPIPGIGSNDLIQNPQY